MADKYDLIVIGSGPGGYVAAIRAAQLGFKTAVVEKDRVGGRCLNYACIPAKAVLRSADVATEAREAADFGIEVGEVKVNFPGVANRRNEVVKRMTGGVGMLLGKNKVDIIEGFGALTDDANVRIGGQFDGTVVEADKVVLACGSIPKPVLGLQFGKRILSTETMWGLDEQPAKLAVIGAGASGTEVASAFGRLGTQVHLFEALPQILPLEDKDIARAAAREIGKQGVTIVTEANVESVDANEDGVTIAWGDNRETFDYLCIAAGRGPDVEGLGLDEAGVKLDERGLIDVDGAQRTSVDGVYAIGDMVRGKALAHKASDEGIIAVEDAKGLETHPIDHPFVPAATFCHPQVASFGLTQAQAEEQGYDVAVGRIPITAVGAPQVYGDRGGMVKIVGDKKYGELLGGHIVCAKAADLIQELVAARDLEGGYPEVARQIHPHPAFAEAVMEAARAADGWLIHG